MGVAPAAHMKCDVLDDINMNSRIVDDDVLLFSCSNRVLLCYILRHYYCLCNFPVLRDTSSHIS